MALNRGVFKATNLTNVLRQTLSIQTRMSAAGSSHSSVEEEIAVRSGLDKIGNREVVCYGLNGKLVYCDRLDTPMPAVRFKENTPDVLTLREVEKGDWKKLTMEQKKDLYRISFCRTLSETYAPTGLWKASLGVVLTVISIGLWMMVGIRTFLMPPMPDTFSEENMKKIARLHIDAHVDPIDGYSSRWDYENNKWKD